MKQFLLAAFMVLLPVGLFSAYETYTYKAPMAAREANLSLGDLSEFKAIIADVQTIAAKKDLTAAGKRATDFESAWDEAQSKLRPLDTAAWSNIDYAADLTLKALRAPTPDPQTVTDALSALATALNNAGHDIGTAAQAAAPIAQVAGIAVTDTAGHAIPCEEMINTLRITIDGGKIGKSRIDEANVYLSKATERCNADDDTHADEFSAQGLILAGK